MSAIVHLNGRPGAGKLTIGLELAKLLSARLLDNHSIYNVAFALTEFQSEDYFNALRAVRKVAFDYVMRLPIETPVIVTNAHFENSNWGRENWDAVRGLAALRGVPLAVVVIDCEPEENRRRVQGESRIGKRAWRDGSVLLGEGRRLLDDGGDATLRLDVTALEPDVAAKHIHEWLEGALKLDREA